MKTEDKKRLIEPKLDARPVFILSVNCPYCNIFNKLQTCSPVGEMVIDCAAQECARSFVIRWTSSLKIDVGKVLFNRSTIVD